MQNNFEFFSNKINKKALVKGLGVEVLENDLLSINNEHLNKFLKLIFKVCSKNEYSFNIIREDLDLIKIEVFDLSKINIFFIKVNFSHDINKISYKAKYEKYKKLKIFPLIGPDGVGKTTLLRTLKDGDNKDKKIIIKRFKKIVRRSIIYNLFYPINRYFLRKELNKNPQKDQHDDRYYLLILLAGLIFYPYLIYKSKFDKNIIFVDRFFNDYLLKNISFLHKKTILRENWKEIIKYIPQVFWNIQLDAKPEVILKRKEELKVRDILKYKNYNFEIYLEKPSFIYTYINTGVDLEKCKIFLKHTLNKVSEKIND